MKYECEDCEDTVEESDGVLCEEDTYPVRNGSK